TNAIEVDSDAPGIRSDATLTLAGTGSLDIDTAGDGVRALAGLVVEEGSLRLNASGDGLRATGYLVLEDGTLTIAADGVGLRADGSDAAGTGYIAVRDPFLTVNAGGDGLRAASDVIVFGGGLEVRTAGGHQSTLAEGDSASALRAGRHLVADDGTFQLDAAGDGVDADDSVVLNGGDWEIAAGDDAVHGDLALAITGGEFAVSTATEGLEAETVTIGGGTIAVAASDDALNASEADSPRSTPSVTITGGSLRLDSDAGDGLDANGDVTMTGGDLLITGADVDNESAIDFDGSFLISGGRLAAGGGAGMAQPPSAESAQRSLWFDVGGRAGDVVTFAGPDGVAVGSYTAARGFGTVVVSSPEVTVGRTYTVAVNGRPVGTTTTADADTAPRRLPGRR
ncbi:MAG: carbohydrate-binding domain-containing protein, partial [Propionicimonas sp.]|nr:carbohydrate-binding domain-containing protein [Propionicimonas sp.]